MSFRDLIETAQSIALSQKLRPDEVAVWERYCREYSTLFHTPLLTVHALDPLFVVQQVSSNHLAEFDPEERLPDLFDMLGSLNDKDYDVNKERALREEMRLLEEREEERLREGRPVHESMAKDKRVISKDESKPKELPKSGGLNMSAINRLNNQDREG